MTKNLFNRIEETTRWHLLKRKFDNPLRDKVDNAIKAAQLIDWQKFHEAMDLLEMSGKLKVEKAVESLLKEAIKG